MTTTINTTITMTTFRTLEGMVTEDQKADLYKNKYYYDHDCNNDHYYDNV